MESKKYKEFFFYKTTINQVAVTWPLLVWPFNITAKLAKLQLTRGLRLKSQIFADGEDATTSPASSSRQRNRVLSWHLL